MNAAWYESQGPAETVLVVGEMPDPVAGPGEVRIRVRASGVNPGDVKKRAGWLGSRMPYPRVIPHSDGAGEIDQVGPKVDPSRLGERVWCYGAQSYRPFGTAAEYVTAPAEQAVRLPDSITFDQGACLGIPGITAHRAVFGDGPVTGRTVLVAGAAGAVGAMAVTLAAWGGATVLATVKNTLGVEPARRAGAARVFVLGTGDPAAEIRTAAPGGIDRIVEVDLGANAALDAAVVAQGGVLAVYASSDPEPALPFWPLLFQNATLRLLGSDDFPPHAKQQAARDLVTCIEQGTLRPEVGARFALPEIASAHQAIERRSVAGRVVLLLS